MENKSKKIKFDLFLLIRTCYLWTPLFLFVYYHIDILHWTILLFKLTFLLLPPSLLFHPGMSPGIFLYFYHLSVFPSKPIFFIISLITHSHYPFFPIIIMSSTNFATFFIPIFENILPTNVTPSVFFSFVHTYYLSIIYYPVVFVYVIIYHFHYHSFIIFFFIQIHLNYVSIS